jgi:hypothetical protein
MMRFSRGGPRNGKAEKLTFGQKVQVLLAGVNMPRPESSPWAQSPF